MSRFFNGPSEWPDSDRGTSEVSDRTITVAARDGRKKMAEIEETMLSPETLAKILLLLLRNKRRRGRLTAPAAPRAN